MFRFVLFCSLLSQLHILDLIELTANNIISRKTSLMVRSILSLFYMNKHFKKQNEIID